MAEEFSESLFLSKLSQDITHIVKKLPLPEHQQEFTSELDEKIYYTGLEMYYNRRGEEERSWAELEAITRKSEMFSWEEQQPEPEPELDPLAELINVEQMLKDLWMVEKEDGFYGPCCEELCS